ncbi:RNA-binding domain-containing protein, partial [Aureobasidium pullulans]
RGNSHHSHSSPRNCQFPPCQFRQRSRTHIPTINMDRSLDEILEERQNTRGGRRGGRGRPDRDGGRGPRRDYERERDFPRDGVKKDDIHQHASTNTNHLARSADRNLYQSFPREDARNIDRDWVHDKFEDDDSRRPTRGSRNDRYDREPARDAYVPYSPDRAIPKSNQIHSSGSTSIRVENIHYDIQEPDLKELFESIGPVESLRLLYDRHDRSQGVAYVVYPSASLADRAFRQFDGQNAMGQPIYLTIQQQSAARPARNPFDNVEKPARSLFDRIDNRRSASPDSRNVDRYVPPGGRDRRSSRSPPRRGGRGAPREAGRRPGARRENTDRRENGGRERGDRRGPGPKENDGRPTVKGRPKKTAEELDAEMDDYWGGGSAANEGSAVASGQNEPGREPQVSTIAGGENNNMGTTSTAPDDDIDLMVE